MGWSRGGFWDSLLNGDLRLSQGPTTPKRLWIQQTTFFSRTGSTDVSRKVKNIGHRGASALAPENTLPAFWLAVDLGADEVELDVVRCATGEPVVIHNETVDKTTDGTGSVRDKSLAELKELDAGLWFDERFQGTRIPTLDEVLELVRGKLTVNIEIKGQSVRADGTERIVLESIRRHGMMNRVVVSSFNPWRLRRARSEATQLKIALIFSPQNSIYLRRAWSAPVLNVDGLHPFHSMIDERFVDRAHKRGKWVYAWTVDDPQTMRKLIRIGVDGIVTNNPGLLKGVLEEDAASDRKLQENYGRTEESQAAG